MIWKACNIDGYQSLEVSIHDRTVFVRSACDSQTYLLKKMSFEELSDSFLEEELLSCDSDMIAVVAIAVWHDAEFSKTVKRNGDLH